MSDPTYAKVQQLLLDPPPSWAKVYRRYGLSSPTPEQLVWEVLDFTPSMADAGPTGECRHIVPEDVQRAALIGLELSHKRRYASESGIGLARSVQLSLSPVVWDRTVKRMAAYFIRHRKDPMGKNFGDTERPSKGYMAWMNWGGYPGWEWARGQLATARLPQSEP